MEVRRIAEAAKRVGKFNLGYLSFLLQYLLGGVSRFLTLTNKYELHLVLALRFANFRSSLSRRAFKRLLRILAVLREHD